MINKFTFMIKQLKIIPKSDLLGMTQMYDSKSQNRSHIILWLVFLLMLYLNVNK